MSISIREEEFPLPQPIPQSILFGSPLLFSPLLAKKLGTKGAIIVQQIHYWLENCDTDLLDCRHFIKKTYAEMSARFPWSIRTTKSIISKLEKIKILVSRVTWDRELSNKCKLYTINYTELLRLNSSFSEKTTYQETSVSSLVQSANSESSKVQRGGGKVQNLHFQPYNIYLYKNNTQRLDRKTRDPKPPENTMLIFERIMTENIKISEHQLKNWVNEHGVDYVTQKIELTTASKPRSPERFLASAIKFNWLPAEKVPTPTKPQEEKMSTFVVEPRHVRWFESLSLEGKNRVMEDIDAAWYMFRHHLDGQKVQISDPDFTSHSLFALMMGILNDYYRYQKPWEPVYEHTHGKDIGLALKTSPWQSG